MCIWVFHILGMWFKIEKTIQRQNKYKVSIIYFVSGFWKNLPEKVVMVLVKTYPPSMILRYFIRVCVWLGKQVAAYSLKQNKQTNKPSSVK